MNQDHTNRLGTMAITPLLLSMSLPIMTSMLTQALYNVIDSIFVSRLSENALAAVSLAFPIQNFMISLAVGTAIGMNAVLSRRLGEKRSDLAQAIAENGVFLALCSTLVCVLFGLSGVKPYFRAFLEGGEIVEMGIQYTSIVTIGSGALFLFIIGERIVQATGNTLFSMYAQMAGAITNIILDPILIFGLLGAPKLGIAGAAYATVIGQAVSMVIIGLLIHFKIHLFRFDFAHYRPSLAIIREIYHVGLPSIVMQSVGSVMTFGMNRILILFSETAVAVFGIYFKLQSFILMPVFGMNSGMVPIIGYNYGARNRLRITQTVKTGCVIATMIMAFGVFLFQVFPEPAMRYLFDASDDMIAIGVPALRRISLCFIFAGMNIVLSSTFQAMGKGGYSLILALVRQLVFLLPLAYLLGRMLSIHALWYSFPLAELAATVLSLWLYKRLYRKQILPLDRE